MKAKRTPKGVVVRQKPSGTSIAIRYTDGSGARRYVHLGYAHEGWTVKKAADELAKRKVAAMGGAVEPSGKVTLASFGKDYLERAEARGLKRSSLSTLRTHIVTHLTPELGHIRIDRLSLADVERYVTRKTRAGASPRTVNSHLTTLSQLLKDGIRRGVCTRNVVDSVERPKERPQQWRILTPAEFRAVDKSFATLDHFAAQTARGIFLVAFECGLRRGELLGLRWSAVKLADPAGPTIRVERTFLNGHDDTPKSATSSRTIPISNSLASFLMDLRASTPLDGDDEFVFPSSTGRPFDVTLYARLFREAAEAAGIAGADQIRPLHDLRHSSITNGAISGMSPAALQSRAGHSSFSTTQRYISLAGQTFREEATLLQDRLYGEQIAG